MLNMPSQIKEEILDLRDYATSDGDALMIDLCNQALSGNHMAWMLCVETLLDEPAN